MKKARASTISAISTKETLRYAEWATLLEHLHNWNLIVMFSTAWFLPNISFWSFIKKYNFPCGHLKPTKKFSFFSQEPGTLWYQIWDHIHWGKKQVHSNLSKVKVKLPIAQPSFFYWRFSTTYFQQQDYKRLSCPNPFMYVTSTHNNKNASQLAFRTGSESSCVENFVNRWLSKRFGEKKIVMKKEREVVLSTRR